MKRDDWTEQQTNCPNCGAPITGPTCEYCGTVFEREDPAVRIGITTQEALEAVQRFAEAVNGASNAFNQLAITRNEARAAAAGTYPQKTLAGDQTRKGAPKDAATSPKVQKC